MIKCTETEEPLIKLKRNHSYYSQIQGQMGVTEINCSYIFVFTHHGYHLEKIEFQPEYWNDMLFHLQCFWEKYVGPELLLKKYAFVEKTSDKSDQATNLSIKSLIKQNKSNRNSAKHKNKIKVVAAEVHHKYVCGICFHDIALIPKVPSENSIS